MLRWINVLRSGDRRVVLQRETDVSGRKVYRRIDIDAELGLITCVWIGPAEGQTVHPRAKLQKGFIRVQSVASVRQSVQKKKEATGLKECSAKT